MHMQLDHRLIDLFLAPRYLLYSAAICIDIVRLVNRELPNESLQIRLLSTRGGAVPSSSGIPLQTDAIDSQPQTAGTVVVLSSYEPEQVCTAEVLSWLRGYHQRGGRMACIETAAFIFAQAGIFRSASGAIVRDVAAHFEAAPGYHELFGETISLDHVFNRDGRFYSCAGGTSTLDMMLSIVESIYDEALAERLAYVLNHHRLTLSERKPVRPEGAITTLDRRLGRIVSLMQASIAEPMPLALIYRKAHVEASTARRMFHRVLRQSPAQYYRSLRLQYARDMLQNSSLLVGEVAEASGFASVSAFSRAFRQAFGSTPGSLRRPPGSALAP
jgi:transcriptional regulator GlxA family with amidase domain